MHRPDQTLFEIQSLVTDLALINRNHYLAKLPEHENDIEHSFAVAMLCWRLRDKYAPELNLEKILKYALVHDFAERYAGDVNAFASKEARLKKIELEKVAVARLSKEFSDFTDLVQTLQRYESQQDEESRFVWTVDKMQALILGDMDDWRPFQNLSISYTRFAEKHAELLTKSSKYCRDFFAELVTYCQSTYYDQP